MRETYIINTAFDNLQSQKDNAGQVAEVVIKPQNYIPSNCATALLRLTQEGNGMTQSSNSAHFVVSEDIVFFLLNLYHTHVFRDNATIVVHSEVVKDGVLYRAHPFYYTAKRPWYDFAMIRFGKDNLTDNFAVQECFAWHGDPDNIREDHHYAPGRILAFLHEQTNEVIKGKPINDMDDILAVVATCKYQHNRSSMFTTEWQSEYTYDHQRRKHQRLMLLPVSSFVRQ